MCHKKVMCLKYVWDASNQYGGHNYMSDLDTKMSANNAFVFELSQTRRFVHIIKVGLELYKTAPIE